MLPALDIRISLYVIIKLVEFSIYLLPSSFLNAIFIQVVKLSIYFAESSCKNAISIAIGKTSVLPFFPAFNVGISLFIIVKFMEFTIYSLPTFFLNARAFIEIIVLSIYFTQTFRPSAAVV